MLARPLEAAVMAKARSAGVGGDHLVECHADAPPRNFFLVAKNNGG